MKKILLLSLTVAFLTSLKAQDKLEINPILAKQWLMEIEGDTVTVGEFWQVFNKNNFKNEQPTKESLNEYFDLYQKFKLKVKEAEFLGLDTTDKFKKELEGYQKQLAQSYLTDKKVTEELVQEAIERSKWEINASHILIQLKQHSLPSDTLEAYKKAKMIQQKAINGEDFNELAALYSEDPSAKENKGKLGYFSAFKMVYPFESGAYNTRVGGVSELIRTRFGYHIIKVQDKRKSLGQIKVAHIMLVLPNDLTPDQKNAKKEKINEIYNQLKAGETFESLAIKYSEHNSSASSGGVLPWFTSNQYDEVFESAAFGLAADNEFSAPIQTTYGWHIIKRLERKDLESVGNIENETKKKISRSDRASVSKEAVLNRIKKDYAFTEKSKRKNINWFFENTDSTLVTGSWKIPAGAKLNKELFMFAGKKYVQKDFADYLINNLVPRKGSDSRQLVNFMYDQWVEQLCFDHEESRLPFKNQEYARLLKEYRDGIILFDLTDKKVWSKAVSDSTGLESYYQTNKSKWMWDERVKGELYVCSEEINIKKVKQLLSNKASMSSILAKINKDSQLNVRAENVFNTKKQREELSVFDFKIGVSDIKKHNTSFVILKTLEIVPVSPKALDEVRGLVAADYQDYLMDNWVKELKAKYKLNFNLTSLGELIKYAE